MNEVILSGFYTGFGVCLGITAWALSVGAVMLFFVVVIGGLTKGIDRDRL